MKYLIILLLLTQITYCDIDYRNSGSLDYSLSHMDGKSVNTLDLIINNDVMVGDNSKIVFSPAVFVNDGPTYNSIVKGYVTEIREIYINELYYSYLISDNLNLAVGVFPFRKGTFYEYGFNGERAGNGIYSVTDIVLQGAILSYKINDILFQIGKVNYDEYFKSYYDYKQTDLPITYDSYKGSGMDYIAAEQTINKWYYEIELAKMHQYINGYNVINSKVATLALSYNDDDESGRTYYTILSGSRSEGDTGPLAYTFDSMYLGVPPSGPRPPFENKAAHYTKFKISGYYMLFGIKQELDNIIFGKDIVLGVEYAYRSPGYHSLLAGRPLSPHAYGDIGHFYNVSVGMRINKHNMVKVRYYVYDTDKESTKYGFTPVHTKASNVPGSKTKYDAIVLQWYYDF